MPGGGGGSAMLQNQLLRGSLKEARPGGAAGSCVHLLWGIDPWTGVGVTNSDGSAMTGRQELANMREQEG